MSNGMERIYQHDFLAMRRCRHGTFLYNVNDLFISRSLDCYGEWCEDELDALGQILKPGDVVLDVGANIGTHTVFFAKKVTERGCVFAFEPQRLIFQNLCANIAINGLINVVAMQRGVGRRSGTIRLPIFLPRQEMNSGAVSILGHTTGEPVEVIRIDDLGLGQCDLIKVDVEGMECDVLEGARATIARFRPPLFVENNTLDRSSATIGLIDSLGYDAYWHICEYFNPDNFRQNGENIFGTCQPEANLLCFHRDQGVNIRGLPKVLGTEDNWRSAVLRGRDEGSSQGGGGWKHKRGHATLLLTVEGNSLVSEPWIWQWRGSGCRTARAG